MALGNVVFHQVAGFRVNLHALVTPSCIFGDEAACQVAIAAGVAVIAPRNVAPAGAAVIENQSVAVELVKLVFFHQRVGRMVHLDERGIPVAVRPA